MEDSSSQGKKPHDSRIVTDGGQSICDCEVHGAVHFTENGAICQTCFGQVVESDGGQPRDFPRDGRRWPNSRPQGGRTRRDSRLKRHADWQAGVLVGLACAALIGLLWRLLR